MPTGTRHRFNGIFGTVTDNPLTAGSGTFNSAGLSEMGVVSAPDHAIVTLDPLKQFGAPEIVIVTVHTAAATVATITRGAYGTTARSHPQGTLWVHAPLDEDFMEVGTTAGRPTDPYFGQPYFNTTLNAQEVRDTVPSWKNVNMLADPPACRVFHSVDTSIADNTVTTFPNFDSERYDTDSMHDTVTNNSRITINTAGLYTITFTGILSGRSDYDEVFSEIRLNNTTTIANAQASSDSDTTVNPRYNISTVYKLAVSDFVTVRVYQNNAANVAVNVLRQDANSAEFSATWVGRG